jgi:anti-sigma factor RsiW
MRCQEVIANLDAYLVGELSPAMCAEVGLHVETCNDCQRALDRTRRLASLLAETPVPPVPDHFAERVFARVKNRRVQKARTWSIRTWWLSISAPMRAAAAAVLLVGAISGMIFGWSDSRVPLDQAGQKDVELAGYGMDTLDDAPDGSLANSYLALLAGRNGEGR